MTKKLYSTELRVFATAYVWADNDKEAVDLFRTLSDTGIEFSAGYQSLGENVCMDGRPYPVLKGNPERLALSPAMTIDRQLVPITMVEEVELEPEASNDL